jgi:hypothetical protein
VGKHLRKNIPGLCSGVVLLLRAGVAADVILRLDLAAASLS